MSLLVALSVPPALLAQQTVDGICERTDAVQAAILTALSNVDACADVSNAKLAGITGTLQVGGGQGGDTIDELKAGDFDGLTNLAILNLGSNNLSTLPEGVFDELTALYSLHLNSNQLQTIPAGVFDELTALQALYLNYNERNRLRLTTLPAGVFDRLTALQYLFLQNNGMNQLPEGLFENLAALKTLNLSGNRLKQGVLNNGNVRLPDGIFEPLTALTDLDLSGQRNDPRIAPEAIAGPDDGRVSIGGGTVTLDGSASGGPWGTNVTYAWALTSPANGVMVTFDDATGAMPQVTIPQLASANAELTFTLTVSALSAPGHTTAGIEDDTDTVTVTVNTAPTASDSTITTDEDETYTFATGDFNFADEDAGDALANVTVVTLPGAGALVFDGTPVTAEQSISATENLGKLEFTPAQNAYGSYRIRASPSR